LTYALIRLKTGTKKEGEGALFRVYVNSIIVWAVGDDKLHKKRAEKARTGRGHYNIG